MALVRNQTTGYPIPPAARIIRRQIPAVDPEGAVSAHKEIAETVRLYLWWFAATRITCSTHNGKHGPQNNCEVQQFHGFNNSRSVAVSPFAGLDRSPVTKSPVRSPRLRITANQLDNDGVT